MGLFDKMFDLNHDGKISTFERAARAALELDNPFRQKLIP